MQTTSNLVFSALTCLGCVLVCGCAAIPDAAVKANADSVAGLPDGRIAHEGDGIGGESVTGQGDGSSAPPGHLDDSAAPGHLDDMVDSADEVGVSKMNDVGGCNISKPSSACSVGVPSFCSGWLGGSWNQFGGNSRNSGLFPVPIGNSIEIDWKKQVGADPRTPPTIGLNGNIYVGYFAPIQGPALVKFGIRALSAKGVSLWNTETGGWCRGALVASAGGSVFGHCDDGNLYRLSDFGVLQWSKFVGWTGPAGSASKLGADGAIRVGTLSGLVAVSGAGELLWKRPELPTYASSVALDGDDAAYVRGKVGIVTKVGGGGFVLWQQDLVESGGLNQSAPVLVKDTAVLVTSTKTDKFGGGQTKLWALGTTDGNQLWVQKIDGVNWAAPAVDHQGRIFFGSSSRWLHAFSAAGTPLWKKWLDGHVRAPAVGCNGHLLVSTGSGRIYKVSASGDGVPHLLYSEGGAPIIQDSLGGMSRVVLGRDERAYAIGSVSNLLAFKFK